MPDHHPRMSLGGSTKRATPSGGFPASPVPSKLRNGRRTQDDVAPTSRARGGSRLFSMTESVVGNRRAGSVATDFTARGQQSAAAGIVARNGLARGAVLGKDKVHTVLATGEIPAEVWNALQSFDANEDISTTSAFVDPSIGWTALTTSSVTYVWNYAKRTTSASPTCYTFPHDQPTSSRRSSSASAAGPLTALVSHANTSATGNEPGLLLVYPTSGTVVFWDRVGMGLMGGAAKGKGKGRVELGVELGKGEVVNGLEKLERDTYLISTSHTRVIRLSLSHTSGNPSILVKPFEILTRKVFIATSSTPFLFPSASASSSSSSSSSSSGGKGIVGIAVGEAVSPSKGLVKGMTGDAVRDVWLLTREECQRWSVGVEVQKLHSHFPLKQILLNSSALNAVSASSGAVVAMHDARNSGNRDIAESLQLLDIAALANARLAVLVAYVQSKSNSGEMSFAVFVLREDAMVSDNLVVENVVCLEYREKAGIQWEGAARPVLVAPRHGRAVFVKFPRAVVICSLAEGLPYQQAALLCDDSSNAFIGNGSILDADPTHYHHTAHHGSSAEESAQFWTLVPQSGMICLEASVDALIEVGQSVDMFTGDAQLKTRLEQAVFFSDPRNPLTFDLQPGYSGSIETVALQVSDSIVYSTYSDQSHLGDMAQEFEKRLHWLRQIIQFILKNHVLDSISLNARQRLAVNYKVVSSGAGLWTFLNVRGRLSMLGSGNYLSFLGDAILDWAEEHTQVTEHEDVIRAFFKHHLTALPDVLNRVRHVLQSRYESESAVTILSEWQLAVNEAYLIAFEAALVEGMADTIEMYGFDPMKAVSTRLWLTDEAVVDDLKYAYHQSVHLLRTRTGHFGSAIDDAVEAAEDDTREQQQKQQVLKGQISRMVYPLCYALEARARYAAHEMDRQPDQRGAIQYHEQYENDMQEAIVALTSINVELAYHIAEHHLHYAALVYLATNENFGSVDRLEQYMRGHIGSAQDERTVAHQASRFAQQLYSMYYKQERYYELLDQRPEYYHLLSDFFRRQDAPKLAWIHHVNMEQLDKAGEALVKASLSETRLQGQQIMLSISKLGLIADSRKNGKNEESRAQTLDYIEDRLELGTQTERMVQMIIDIARPVSSLHRNADKEVQRYMAAKCQNLGDYPHHIELYRKIAKDAASGLVITHEDLADLLTLKDNMDDEIQDYVQAVQICRVIPKSEGTSKNRQTACLRSLWRRIWLHDDWIAIADTSKQTDEEIHARRAGTAAFQLIQAVQSGDLPSDFMLTPQVAATMPSETELEARFGPTVDIRGLLDEQIAEAERLQSLIEQDVFTDFINSIEA